MKTITIVTLIIFSITTAYANQNFRSVDAANFDIAGVKLGMTYDQAIAVVKENLEVNADQIGTSYMPNSLTGKKDTRSFSIHTPDYVLSVDLTPSMKQPNMDTYVVWNIEYMLPTRSNIKWDDVVQSALKKYGKPSNTTGENNGGAWCKNPKKPTSLMSSVDCDSSQEAVLGLKYASLTLTDARARKALTDYLNKQKEVKPKF